MTQCNMCSSNDATIRIKHYSGAFLNVCYQCSQGAMNLMSFLYIRFARDYDGTIHVFKKEN